MKWLWIAFALVWALSIVLDGRRRAGVHRAARADRAPEPVPQSNDPLPVLLTPRETH